mmetsp:Transcript_40967/g.96216  ORF Transcript_40967/g.96216 Transcript_40967/m.96216 type:complete len:318 (+) Transcript_40967:114-1067(+)
MQASEAERQLPRGLQGVRHEERIRYYQLQRYSLKVLQRAIRLFAKAVKRDWTTSEDALVDGLAAIQAGRDVLHKLLLAWLGDAEHQVSRTQAETEAVSVERYFASPVRESLKREVRNSLRTLRGLLRQVQGTALWAPTPQSFRTVYEAYRLCIAADELYGSESDDSDDDEVASDAGAPAEEMQHQERLLNDPLFLDWLPKNMSKLSDRLKDDKELVMIAVGRHFEAIKFASSRLRRDPDVVRAALGNATGEARSRVLYELCELDHQTRLEILNEHEGPAPELLSDGDSSGESTVPTTEPSCTGTLGDSSDDESFETT